MQFFFIHSNDFKLFPDIDLPDRVFADIPFKELPIVNISVSKNNTIMSVTKHDGNVIAMNTAGREGYKNCRKGTNIAGQATAISLSKVYFIQVDLISLKFINRPIFQFSLHENCLLNISILFDFLFVARHDKRSAHSSCGYSWTRCSSFNINQRLGNGWIDGGFNHRYNTNF